MKTELLIKQNLKRLADKYHLELEEDNGVYLIDDDRLYIAVYLQQKFVGIEILVKVDGKKLFYRTDTDLYDISKPGEAAFKETIELDVNALLYSLAEGRFLVGAYKDRPSMIIPTSDGAVRVKKGRFGHTSSRFETVEKAKSTGIYSILDISK